MLTIGVAGHIDHGKSSLVKALTNIDPDRLPEEKLRGMTLDLGFAWLTLDSGRRVGIVDVPGHEHFVRNVIPGMSGLHAAILVVAADDGWMPQTEEHLQIINLLGIERCIIVINKIDLADPEWLDMVEEDIRDRVRGTVMEKAPIIRVSTRDGRGIEQVKKAIADIDTAVKESDIGRPRLPVDRVFNIKGSGVVVTGTLAAGSMGSGDEVTVLPQGLTMRIRGLECYKELKDQISPGCRVALNLGGVKKEDLSRGDVIVERATDLCPSSLINVRLTLLANPEFRIKTGEEVLSYIETGEYQARVILMGSKVLRGGESGFAQLALSRKAPVFIGQKLVIRRQSPADTVGGGVILDPRAERFRQKDLDKITSFLGKRESLELEKLISTELEKYRYIEKDSLLNCSFFSESEIRQALDDRIAKGELKTAAGFVFTQAWWSGLKDRLLAGLSSDYESNRLKKGMDQAGLQGQLDIPRDIFSALVAELSGQGKIVRQGELVSLPGQEPELSPAQKALADKIVELFRANPSAPPTIKELAAKFGQSDVIYFLIEQGDVVQLPEGVLLLSSQYSRVRKQVVDFINANGRIAIQDLNRIFGFSRKYSLPVLAQLDKEKVTRREGDYRVLA